MENKAQISMEFLLIIAGVVFIAAVIALIIKKSILTPLTTQVKGEVKEFKWNI